jgi:hypothetical protein
MGEVNVERNKEIGRVVIGFLFLGGFCINVSFIFI